MNLYNRSQSKKACNKNCVTILALYVHFVSVSVCMSVVCDVYLCWFDTSHTFKSLAFCLLLKTCSKHVHSVYF